REQSEVLRQYQARFRYILVDEYQDTNVAQYLWLRLLGQATTRSGISTESKVAESAADSTSPRLRGEHSRPSAGVLSAKDADANASATARRASGEGDSPERRPGAAPPHT